MSERKYLEDNRQAIKLDCVRSKCNTLSIIRFSFKCANWFIVIFFLLFSLFL